MCVSKFPYSYGGMMSVRTNRLMFGTLVSSLREDLRITQNDLADKSGLRLTQLRDIEQGLKVDLLRESTLIKLALALQLTTLERYQFFLAASGILPSEIFKGNEMLTLLPFDARMVLEDICAIVKKLPFPAFIVDSYCDIVAANAIVIELMEIHPSILNTADNVIGGYNLDF
jgi:transcriptional regulator with XRE-family HTH domain